MDFEFGKRDVDGVIIDIDDVLVTNPEDIVKTKSPMELLDILKALSGLKGDLISAPIVWQSLPERDRLMKMATEHLSEKIDVISDYLNRLLKLIG